MMLMPRKMAHTIYEISLSLLVIQPLPNEQGDFDHDLTAKEVRL